MKRYLILIIICLAPLLTRGQSGTVVKINYTPALPLGETAEFTKNLSPRGVGFEVNRFLADDFTAGLAMGWNIFREKIVGESFEFDDLLVTGTQFRYTNIVPLNATAKKYFGSSDRIPYFGIGLGTTYTRQTLNAGIFSAIDNQWQFNLAPEAGIEARLSSGLLFSLKIKYSYSLKTGDFPAMSFLGLGAGIGWY